MKHLLPILFIIASMCFAYNTNAQITGPEQDCINAIPVCQSVYVQNNFYTGFGDIRDVSAGASCLANGETNSVWYIFTVTTPGMLEFLIIPHGTQDYDFALYNLTGHSCADIYAGGLEVRCNYSSASLDTIGLKAGYTATSASSSGHPFLAPLQVNTGETFVLVIDKFNSDPIGYTLDFGPSTASIYDMVPPQIDTVIMPTCGNATTITVQFTEPVQCSSLGNNFTISGPSSVNVAATGDCSGGFTQLVELELSARPIDNAQYTLQFNPTDSSTAIEDGCGNVFATGVQTFSFQALAEWISADFTFTCSGGRSFSFTNTSQGDSLTYHWIFNDGGTSDSTEHATHQFTQGGRYYEVTLIAQNAACSDTITKQVLVRNSYVANFQLSHNSPHANDTITFYNDSPGFNSSLWSVDGSSTSTDHTVNYLFPSAGQYNVCLISTAECYTDTICKNIDVLPPVGISALPHANSFEVFPNPVSGMAQIKLKELSGSHASVILFDAVGQRITSYPFSDSPTLEIDFSTLPAGIYLVQVSTPNYSAMQRVVKL